MPSSHIIRIPRTDADGGFILGEVTSTGGSKQPLNLTIVATEGDAAYEVKLRQTSITTHLTSSAPCSPSEWESILTSLLLTSTPPPAIEPGAELSPDGQSLLITIRRRVAGINQRLGTIPIPLSKSDEAIQLFDWCNALALERATLQSAAAASAVHAQEQDAQIAALQAQLVELTEAKKKRETELLEKCCLLINEKKVKIRELQGLVLAGGATPQVGGGGGRGKRKVREEEDDEEDDQEMMMDVDQGSPVGSGREDEEEEDAGRVTPETETGSEGEDEEEPVYKGKGKGKVATKGKAREVTPPPKPKPKPVRRRPTVSPEPVPQASIAHRTRHAVAVVAKPEEGSETESDDEL